MSMVEGRIGHPVLTLTWEARTGSEVSKPYGLGMHPVDLAELHLESGDRLWMWQPGSDPILAAPESHPACRAGQALAGAWLSDHWGHPGEVVVVPVGCRPAERLVTEALQAGYTQSDEPVLPYGLPLMAGMMVHRVLRIVETTPPGPVFVTANTHIEARTPPERPYSASYDDIGGLDSQLRTIRELVEWPLQYPELYTRLGVEPVKGILLSGPPGTGKTLLARAIAESRHCHFIPVSGPEILRRYYGDSEGRLREIFQEARERQPTIIFFDEIDALTPSRGSVDGEVEKRVVTQLATLLDGFEANTGVMVLAATNRPDHIDPALLRPGRFDRTIHIPLPGLEGRQQILQIHMRHMPIAGDVDRKQLARLTPGFSGADLRALCFEAGMNAAREQDPGELASWIPKVAERHFRKALDTVHTARIRGPGVRVARDTWPTLWGSDTIPAVLGDFGEYMQKTREACCPAGLLLIGPLGSGKASILEGVAFRLRLPLLELSEALVMTDPLCLGRVSRYLQDGASLFVLVRGLDDWAHRHPDWMPIVRQWFTSSIPEGAEVVLGCTAKDAELLDGDSELAFLVEEYLRPLPLDVRQKLLEQFLRDVSLKKSVDVATLGILSDGLTAGELYRWLKKTARLAARERTTWLSPEHFQRALRDIHRQT